MFSHTTDYTMAGYQMVELMDRSEWNVVSKEPQWRQRDEPESSSEDMLADSFQSMIDKDMKTDQLAKDQAKKSHGEQKEKEDKCSEAGKVEHYAVDNMDLGTYRPHKCRRDALLSAVQLAFDKHHPIVFSPDLVYGYLAKGIALHINKYPEELRKLYVSHDGKKELIYINDSFVRGKKENDWADMFNHFADQLKTETKGNSVVQNDLKFSTSTPMTEAHRHVLAMESMKSYFEYTCCTVCGISCVILEGTSEDWKLLQEKVTAQLREINDYCEANPEANCATLKWWSPAVEVMLENFVSTYNSQKRGEELSEELKLWWSTIYKYNAARGSGGVATATGWVNIFYPYLKRDVQNPWVTHASPIIKNKDELNKKLESFFKKPMKRTHGFGRKYEGDEVKLSDYPSYVASVPFKWVYLGDDFHLKALIGYSILAQVCVSGAQYPEGSLKLFTSWVLYYTE